MDASKPTRAFAKQLRRSLALPEAMLWRQIKGRKLGGLHFRRQHPLGPYVLDFYCDTAKLCIEIDGYSHGTADRPNATHAAMRGWRTSASAPCASRRRRSWTPSTPL